MTDVIPLLRVPVRTGASTVGQSWQAQIVRRRTLRRKICGPKA